MNKKIFYVHTDFSKYIFECFNFSFIEKFGHGKIFLKMLSDIKKITKGKRSIYDLTSKEDYLLIKKLRTIYEKEPTWHEKEKHS